MKTQQERQPGKIATKFNQEKTREGKKLKIAVVAQDSQYPSTIQRFLAEADKSYPLISLIGGVQQVAAVAEQEQPDLLMLEGQYFSSMELETLNRVTSRFPDVGVVMLCPAQPPELLIEVMRAGVREVLPTPLTRHGVIDAVERFQQRIALSRMPMHECKVLAFIPCKGGSGATFLATNIAYALAAQENKRVALFDFNLQFGDASLFVQDGPPATSIADVARQIQRLDGSFLNSSMIQVLPNFGMLAAPESPEKAAEIRSEHINPLFQVAMKHYDFVILDVGRELDAISIQALDRADLIFPVLQQTLPSIRDARRMSAAFAALNYPDEKIRLIVNRYKKNADITLDDIESTLNLKIFKVVPNDYAVVTGSVNQGIPATKLAPRSPVAKSLQEIAHELCRGAGQGNLLRKLFAF
ncbi:pilus assembly protein CpaE [Nitrosospira multiformis ATCC 25196]|uniref:Pilus assembly protein CpaE n=2 Tax=Nitrosospira multiformis TaxID=1231 RepID=Q2Y6H5_NITMU|nr:response regulator receiver domain protein (CheY-like) [Nitrosospira multiformis ATCC 25196]SEF92888.1 pilus assembly protein CpaE [Nitrosospira multiformis ATCC 25196]